MYYFISIYFLQLIKKEKEKEKERAPSEVTLERESRERCSPLMELIPLVVLADSGVSPLISFPSSL
jgi:hypothetical protein